MTKTSAAFLLFTFGLVLLVVKMFSQPSYHKGLREASELMVKELK